LWKHSLNHSPPSSLKPYFLTTSSFECPEVCTLVSLSFLHMSINLFSIISLFIFHDSRFCFCVFFLSNFMSFFLYLLSVMDRLIPLYSTMATIQFFYFNFLWLIWKKEELSSLFVKLIGFGFSFSEISFSNFVCFLFCLNSYCYYYYAIRKEMSYIHNILLFTCTYINRCPKFYQFLCYSVSNASLLLMWNRLPQLLKNIKNICFCV